MANNSHSVEPHPTRVTLGAEESASVDKLKQEQMYGRSAKKMAVVDGWPLVEVRLCLPFHSNSSITTTYNPNK